MLPGVKTFSNIIEAQILGGAIFFLLLLSIFGKFFWYRSLLLLQLSVIITFGLLFLMVMILPLFETIFIASSTGILWIAIVLSIAATETFTLLNIRNKTAKYLMALILLIVIIMCSLFTLYKVPILYLENSLFLPYILIILEVTVLLVGILLTPAYFLNSFNVTLAISLLPFLAAVTPSTFLFLTISGFYILWETFISYAIFYGNIKEEITRRICDEIEVTKDGMIKVSISKIFGSDFAYTLYLLGDRFSNSLFSLLNGVLKWKIRDEIFEDAIFEVDRSSWIEAVKKFTSRKNSFRISLSEFLSKTNLNKYKWIIIAQQFEPYILWDKENNTIYYFDSNDRKIFINPLEVEVKLTKLLEFCPTEELAIHLLKQGSIISKKTLLWLLKKLHRKEFSKQRILKILETTDYPFDRTILIQFTKKKGLKGFIEALIKLGIPKEEVLEILKQ